MKKIAAALLGAGLVLGAAPAFAGEWKLNPRLCPDIREDWRDARVTYNRYDRREDRRDRAFTICPRSAFVYVPDRRDRYDRYARDGRYVKGAAYGKYSSHNRRYRTPPLKLKYDRRLRLYYRYDNGRKIYVRG
ncbi:MAG: hypothetical protein R3C60_05630 [Parvularculaceae bacterium]